MAITSTFPKIDRNNPKKAHVIDDISFSKDYIVCTCAWKGAIADFQSHRKNAVGICETCPHSMMAHRDNGNCGNCECKKAA